MFKRLSLALAGLLSLVGIAQAAGTIPGFSLTPQFDLTGKVMPGCRLFIIQAGTGSTPQNAYLDSGLTILLPNPLTCDAAGRLPQWFVADGSIKLRLQTAAGSQVFAGDNLLVIGASSGGGGGSPVDPTTILATGDFKLTYGTGVLTGFVRCNGRTIGNATSGATERANADTQPLYVNLYNADPNLVVSGGRGASAAADFAANKTLTLPPCNGRALAGLDDMGNSPAGVLTSTYAGCTPTTLGALCGSESHTLTALEIPSITSNGPTSFGGTVPLQTGFGTYGNGNAANAGGQSILLVSQTVTQINTAPTSVGSNNTGGNAHSIVDPKILLTVYLKL